MFETPDLTKEFHPVPKPQRKEKAQVSSLKLGKKTKAWTDARAELKKDFAKRGITKCELLFDGCWKNNALTFAHIDKRKNLIYPEDLYKVVLACTPCHQIVEAWPRLKMRKLLLAVIAHREGAHDA